MSNETNTAAAPVLINSGTVYATFAEAVRSAATAVDTTNRATFTALMAGVPLIASDMRAGVFKKGRGGTISKLVASFEKPAQARAQYALKFALLCINGNATAGAIAGCKEAESVADVQDAFAKVTDSMGKPVFTGIAAVQKHFAKQKEGEDDIAQKLCDKVMDLKPGDRARFKKLLIAAEKAFKEAGDDVTASLQKKAA